MSETWSLICRTRGKTFVNLNIVEDYLKLWITKIRAHSKFFQKILKQWARKKNASAKLLQGYGQGFDRRPLPEAVVWKLKRNTYEEP